MKKIIFIFLGLGLLLFVVMAILNPSEEEYKSKVKRQINLAINEMMMSGEMKDNPFAGLGLLLGNKMVDNIVDTYFIRDNYVLFSLATIDNGEKSRIIGVGVFGKIFYSDEFDDLIDEMKKKGKDKTSY